MAEILQNKSSHKILAIMAGLDGLDCLQLIELAGQPPIKVMIRLQISHQLNLLKC